MNLTGRKILVTGATGFIGSRLVQWLVEVEKVDVVALIHNFKNASRISRFPIKMIRGDVRDPAALASAMQGCTEVVHAAVSCTASADDNRAVTVGGARNVCEAALKLGIRRVVYLSTISVYGNMPDGQVDERTECRPVDAYGQDKLDAEAVFNQSRNRELSSVILRLPVVYGPWSFWSTYPLDQFRRGRVILPEGDGICPALYVDDAVRAILCALKTDDIPHAATFLVTGPDKVTWLQFYEEHGRACGGLPVVLQFLPKTEILKHYRQESPGIVRQLWQLRGEVRIIMRIPGARAVLRFLKSTRRRLHELNSSGKTSSSAMRLPPSDVWPALAHVELMATKAFLDCSYIKKCFGFSPLFSFSEGMSFTKAWIKWFNQADN